MKLRSLSVALAVAGASMLCASAYADELHNSGFFLGAGVGYNHQTLPSGNVVYNNSDGTTTTFNNFSAKKYMFKIDGGYLFDLGSGFDLGPILSFNYFGPTSAQDTDGSGSDKMDIYNLNLQAALQYNWQSFFVRAQAGEGYFRLVEDSNDASTASTSEWKPMAGLSAGYYFTPEFNAGIFYQHVFGSTVAQGELLPVMDSIGISVEYAFGTYTSLSGNS